MRLKRQQDKGSPKDRTSTFIEVLKRVKFNQEYEVDTRVNFIGFNPNFHTGFYLQLIFRSGYIDAIYGKPDDGHYALKECIVVQDGSGKVHKRLDDTIGLEVDFNPATNALLSEGWQVLKAVDCKIDFSFNEENVDYGGMNYYG